MKTISHNSSNTLIIQKSIFITELIKVYSLEEKEKELEKIRKKYKDATHYCYAYIIDSNKKSSDDGEPGGTAGVPMLEVLQTFELNYILCIVIRYFGGIKLGAGGLVRAYRKSVSDALHQQSFKEMIDGYSLVVETSYDRQKDLERLLSLPYQKKYQETVIYELFCTKEEKEKLQRQFTIREEKEKKIEL